MTEPERAILRQLLDTARRERLAEDTTTDLCGYCGQPIPEERGPQARYCTPYHRRQAWLQTPHGQAFQKAANRRQWERRKQRHAQQVVA
jgi:hypothetical protein